MERTVKLLSITIAVSAAIASFPSSATASVSPETAGLLSVVPGLGQTVNGDAAEGVAWSGAVAGTFFIDRLWAFDLLQYNMYDAYRDARPKDGRYTDYSFFQNYIAFYNPVNAIDPVGTPLLGAGIYTGLKNHYYNLQLGNIAHYSLVGLGEEGLFRGFLFPSFSTAFSSKFAGAVASSAIFAALHFQYHELDKRLIVGAMGLLLCVQTDWNHYDLRRSMFAHSWIDIFLSNSPGSIFGGSKTQEQLPGIGMQWSLAI